MNEQTTNAAATVERPWDQRVMSAHHDYSNDGRATGPADFDAFRDAVCAWFDCTPEDERADDAVVVVTIP